MTTNNKEKEEPHKSRYLIVFAECNHTMDVDEYAIKQAKRIAGEVFYTSISFLWIHNHI